MKLSWTRWQFMVDPRWCDEGRSGRLFLSDFEIDFAEFLEGAVGADLHGTDRAVEQLGDFLVLEMLEARQHQDLAVLERQAGEGGAEQHDVLGGGGLLGRL